VRIGEEPADGQGSESMHCADGAASWPIVGLASAQRLYAAAPTDRAGLALGVMNVRPWRREPEQKDRRLRPDCLSNFLALAWQERRRFQIFLIARSAKTSCRNSGLFSRCVPHRVVRHCHLR
jgi:hypothetical protein